MLRYVAVPPLQLCLEISISPNSRNLLQFLEVSYWTLYRRKEEKLILLLQLFIRPKIRSCILGIFSLIYKIDIYNMVHNTHIRKN
jgi:hypothetical protein